MNVDYITHSGDDLLVVNAARVSFHKEKKEFGDDDKKLLSYLARHNHWTPFAHPQITVRVKAPIFVARQLYKHKVGMTENEVSRRYVDDEPEFFIPNVWRGRPTNGAKQGSSDEEIDSLLYQGLYNEGESSVRHIAGDVIAFCICAYNSMIAGGIAPEQARMVLPQSMYTTWYWTGSLASYARIYKLRSDPHAQRETQEIAKMISEVIEPLFPVSWEVLCQT